jgi:hypothetical protein
MVSDGYLHGVLHDAAPLRYRAGIERLLAVTEPAPHFVVLPAVEALSFPYLHLRLTGMADHPMAVATASGVAAQVFTPDDHPAFTAPPPALGPASPPAAAGSSGGADRTTEHVRPSDSTADRPPEPAPHEPAPTGSRTAPPLPPSGIGAPAHAMAASTPPEPSAPAPVATPVLETPLPQRHSGPPREPVEPSGHAARVLPPAVVPTDTWTLPDTPHLPTVSSPSAERPIEMASAPTTTTPPRPAPHERLLAGPLAGTAPPGAAPVRNPSIATAVSVPVPGPHPAGTAPAPAAPTPSRSRPGTSDAFAPSAEMSAVAAGNTPADPPDAHYNLQVSPDIEDAIPLAPAYWIRKHSHRLRPRILR